MGSLDGYVFRTTLMAFLLVLVSLTGVIWITQALRGVDLMTSQGQTILVFLGFTSLAIPLLVLVIAPVAIAIAVAHVLNKLATDSEIIVMNAAGIAPRRLLVPFLLATLLVACLVFVIAAFVSPDGQRRLKRWDSEITADLLTNIIKPGEFRTIDKGLTVYIRERAPGGQLRGIFVDDRRNEKERISILSERGTIHRTDQGTFLVLDGGSLQRQESGQRDPALVSFDRYAFDMSRFAELGNKTNTSVRERYVWELANPDPNDPVYKANPQQFAAELHDRLLSPIYPFVFVLIIFAFLGAPRTTRQSRGFSITLSILLVGLVRIAGFALTVMAARKPIGIPLQYAMLLMVGGGSLWIILRGLIIEPPSAWMEALNQLAERITKRFAPA